MVNKYDLTLQDRAAFLPLALAVSNGVFAFTSTYVLGKRKGLPVAMRVIWGLAIGQVATEGTVALSGRRMSHQLLRGDSGLSDFMRTAYCDIKAGRPITGIPERTSRRWRDFAGGSSAERGKDPNLGNKEESSISITDNEMQDTFASSGGYSKRDGDQGEQADSMLAAEYTEVPTSSSSEFLEEAKQYRDNEQNSSEKPVKYRSWDEVRSNHERRVNDTNR